MDNLTHTLVGLTLARTSLERAGRGTTAALVLGSNAPDIDIVTAIGGAANYLEWHRGLTHGPLGVVGLGVASAGVIALGLRLFEKTERPSASFAMLSIAAMIGVLFHVLMDLPTSYGTRIFSPFDPHWYALDWMPIIDVCLLVILTGGLAVRHKRGIMAALVLMVALYGVRAGAHSRAITLGQRSLETLQIAWCDDASPPSAGLAWWAGTNQPSPLPIQANRCLTEIAAIPGIWPFEWRLVAKLSDRYQMANVNLLSPTSPASFAGVQPNEWTPSIARAAETRAAQVFLGFSRFPAAQSFKDTDGSTVVRWVDARFLGVPLFVVTVRTDKAGEIVEAELGGR